MITFHNDNKPCIITKFSHPTDISDDLSTHAFTYDPNRS